MFINDTDKFEEKEMKKIRPIKNTWYDRLSNYIPEPIRKGVGGFKDKVSIFKTNTPKQTVYRKGKKLNKSEDYYYYYKRKRVSNVWNNNQ